MTIENLYQKLIDAYTIRNLNNISLTLINLYKDKQFSILQKIADILEDFFVIEITKNGKGFSKLIKLYHPDKCNFYLNEINSLFEKNNYDALFEYTHILKLERIEEISNSLDNYEDIDYSPVYNWDFNTDGFSVINDNENFRKVHTNSVNCNFYDAIKIRQYGNTDIEFPPYYLEDIEEYELSSSDINDLDGIQYCIHAKNIDLSENRIVNLELFENLNNVEELNLSDNKIENIDALSNLLHLKRLYISNNLINDISPLFELEKLEYVELSGNRIEYNQIREFEKRGVTVSF